MFTIKSSISKEELTELLVSISKDAKKYKFDKEEFLSALYNAMQSQEFSSFIAETLETLILEKDSIKEADDALDILRITSAVERLKQLEEQSKEKEQ
jgi:hypothetical protein